MKLPLWAWDPKDEKYIVVPLELLKQYSDGQWGLDWPVLISGNHSAKAKEFFEGHYSLFDIELKDKRFWRYVLKNKGGPNDPSVVEE